MTPGRRALVSALRRAVADPGRTAFLDVETTGLSRHYHDVTLVGVILGGEAHCWLAGDDPAGIQALLDRATTIVTFNGKAFDVGFLRKLDAEVRLPAHHVDLRYAVRQVGLAGGQKRIEREIGVARGDLEGVDGGAAVSLWRRYARGDVSALGKLIAYNRADLDGMRAIVDHLVRCLAIDEGGLFPVHRFHAGHVEGRSWAAPGIALPTAADRGLVSVDRVTLFGERLDDVPIVGLDLTGSEARPTGYAVLVGGRVDTARVATDDEIVDRILADRPTVVSIDSPLCLPAGRTSVFDDDPGRREFGIMRQCERTLKRRGINVYPSLLPSMQRLTSRGMALALRLRGLGIPVIESYPGAAQDIVGLPRKQDGLVYLAEALAGFGVGGSFLETPVSHDELDAITCALVGAFFLDGRYEPLGGPGEDPLIVPSLDRRPRRRIVGVSGRIAAGKTTLARLLEARGYAYARYSEVVADEVSARGLAPGRAAMQAVGWELSVDRGQRWLGERLMDRVGDASACVIDGLRFPDDHAFMFEQAGFGFRHVHVGAAAPLRAARYACNERVSAAEFATIDAQPVEMAIGGLVALADRVVLNEGSLAELETAVGDLLAV